MARTPLRESSTSSPKGTGLFRRSTWRVGARIQEETMGKEYQFFNGEGLHNESIDLGFNLKNGLYFNGG